MLEAHESEIKSVRAKYAAEVRALTDEIDRWKSIYSKRCLESAKLSYRIEFLLKHSKPICDKNPVSFEVCKFTNCHKNKCEIKQFIVVFQDSPVSNEVSTHGGDKK